MSDMVSRGHLVTRHRSRPGIKGATTVKGTGGVLSETSGMACKKLTLEGFVNSDRGGLGSNGIDRIVDPLGTTIWIQF